jgi:hypothetical protein
MNRLVDALLARQEVIGLMTRPDAVSFRELLDALGEAMLSRPEQERVFGAADLASRLEAGYLPVISAPDWEHAISLAQGPTATESGWWTVMIPAPDGRSGVTVPQDSSASPRLALFTGASGRAGVLAYDPALGEIGEYPGEAHCGPPSRGLCDPGVCRGCTAFPIYDRKTRSMAIKCMCPDQVG